LIAERFKKSPSANVRVAFRSVAVIVSSVMSPVTILLARLSLEYAIAAEEEMSALTIVSSVISLESIDDPSSETLAESLASDMVPEEMLLALREVRFAPDTAGSVVESEGTPLLLVTRTALLAVAILLKVSAAVVYRMVLAPPNVVSPVPPLLTDS
jgi:hypothetical protein